MKKGLMLANMITLAANKHAGQLDRGGEPYILHTLEVMRFLNSGDEELRAAAVGHDLFEDTNATSANVLDTGASLRVVHAIEAVTKLEGESYEEYKQKVFSSVDGMRVKRADLKHNSDITRLKGVTEKDIRRMARYNNFYLEIEVRLQDHYRF